MKRCSTKSSSRVFHARAARASAALHAVGGDGRALHVAGVAEGDGDLFVGDQIFENYFGGFVFDAGAAFVSVKIFYFFEFFDDDFAKFGFGGEDGFVVFDARADFFLTRWKFRRSRVW